MHFSNKRRKPSFHLTGSQEMPIDLRNIREKMTMSRHVVVDFPCTEYKTMVLYHLCGIFCAF